MPQSTTIPVDGTDQVVVHVTQFDPTIPVTIPGSVTISAPSGIGSYDVINPLIRGTYNFSLPDAPGVVAANNYMAILNPVGNTHNVIPLGVFISTYVTSGASTTRNSLQGSLANLISGGTLITNSQIAKFQSVFPNATAQVFVGNPAATINANVFNSPPPINATTSQYVHSVGAGASFSGGPLVLLPGEGFVIHSAAGNTSQTWNISLLWAEI